MATLDHSLNKIQVYPMHETDQNVVSQAKFFEETTFNPDDPRCNSSQYFREICQIIDLSEIYKFLGTCYYDDNMSYCPILLQIGPERIKKCFDDCDYLLQVWNKDQKKIMNRPLKYKIKNWAICYRYLIYTLEQVGEADESNYCYIVDFESNNSTVKVKGFGLDPSIKFLQYHKTFAYAANEGQIFVTQVTQDKFNNNGTTLDIESLTKKTIDVTLAIKGLLMNKFAAENNYIFVVFETPDNLIDLNQLYIENFNDEKYSYKFNQWRELVPRPKSFVQDAVTKIRITLQDNWLYAVALRKSGNVDIYWNGLLKDSTTDQYVEDVDLTSDTYFFKMQDGRKLQFNHKGLYAINFTLALPIEDEDFDWSEIPAKQVQRWVNIYKGMKIFTMGRKTELKSLIALSHDKFVSIFNITDWKWVNHEIFQDEFFMLFMHNNKKANLNYTAGLTQKGWCHIGVMYNGGMRQDVITENLVNKRSGKVLKACEDTINQESLMILHEDPKDASKLALSIVYQQDIRRHDMYITSKRVGIGYIKVQPSKNAYCVIQNDKKINFYLLAEKEDVFRPILIKQLEFDAIKGIVHTGCSYDVNEHIFLFDETNLYVIKFETMSIKTYENVFVSGIYVVNKSYIYALGRDNKTAKNPGIRLFSMESTLKKDTLKMMLLKNQDIGCFGEFEYNENLMRFGMIRSITSMYIMPILHCNTNRFMDSAYPNDYIGFKRIGNKEMTLMDNGCLSAWNIVTGKKLGRKILTEHNYTEYTLKGRKNCPILLVSNQNVPEKQEDTEYFQPYQFESFVVGQVPNLKTLTFNYKRYKLVDITSENDVEVALEFIRPTFNFQLIFINKDRDRMIEILTNQRASIYRREQIEGQPAHMVKWVFMNKIPDYSQEVQTNNDTLEQFTPCFKRFLVLDKQNSQFLLKDTYTNEVLKVIPKDIMELEDVSLPRHTMNRMRLLDERTMIIVSLEGVEKIIDLDKDFKELSYNYRPLFLDVDPTNPREFEDFQYYIRRRDYFTYTTLLRLKRTYQEYKTAYYLHNQRDDELLSTQIIVDPHKFSFNSSSFTFLHWSLIEQLANGKITTSDIDDDVLELILYNILPGGKTVLHTLVHRDQELIKILEMSHPDMDTDKPKYHVPFLPDYNGHTPIHLCIAKLDYKTADQILKYLKFYPADHHSRAIKSTLSELIDKKVSELEPYLESRFQQTNQMKKMIKGCLKADISGTNISSLWVDITDFNKKFISMKPIEDRMIVELLDLPGVYHFSDPEYDQIISALAATDKMEIFELRSIQKLIDFNFSLTRRYIIFKLFLPFIVFMVAFFILMNFIYILNKETHPWKTIPLIILIAIIVIFSTYFLINEAIQLKNFGYRYFKQFWNYIDIIPPLGIYIASTLLLVEEFEVYNVEDQVMRSILSVITFFMWFKVLYFLRIFRRTGYLIRMIFEVVIDMRNFFLVLLIAIAAFGDSFLRLSLGNDLEDQYVVNFLDSLIYTYTLILGNIQLSFGQTDPNLARILLILCTAFVMIVMLNLLISIISTSYDRINTMANQTTYQERASMIVENHYLIPKDKKNSYAEKDKFLLVVTNVDKQSSEAQDPIVKEINEKIEKVKMQLKETHQALEEKIDKHHKESTEQRAKRQAKKAQFLSLFTMKTETIQTHVCPNSLKKTCYFLLNQINPAKYANGWFCEGMNVSCILKKNGFNSDKKEIVYHCDKCNYDYCVGCYEFYGNDHEHPMEKIVFADLQAKNKGYASWGCDGRYKPAKCEQKNYTAEFDPIYHDDVTGYDLCESCALKFQKGKVNENGAKKVEPPKPNVEPPKAEPPKPQPKVEPPKAEPPKPQPQVEPPKAEPAKIDKKEEAKGDESPSKGKSDALSPEKLKAGDESPQKGQTDIQVHKAPEHSDDEEKKKEK